MQLIIYISAIYPEPHLKANKASPSLNRKSSAIETLIVMAGAKASVSEHETSSPHALSNSGQGLPIKGFDPSISLQRRFFSYRIAVVAVAL